MAGSMTTASADAEPTVGIRRRMPLTAPLVMLAVVAVIVFAVFGVMGLTANPVKSHNANGTTTLQGSFEPYQCSASSCAGYIQAGARSVFVQFPAGCTGPARGSTVTVTARPALDLGNASYRALRCV